MHAEQRAAISIIANPFFSAPSISCKQGAMLKRGA